jgi:hypothetical protein
MVAAWLMGQSVSEIQQALPPRDHLWLSMSPTMPQGEAGIEMGRAVTIPANHSLFAPSFALGPC